MRSRNWLLLPALSLALPAGVAAQAPQQPPRKAVKVWTNDDIEALRKRSQLSSFSSAGAPGAEAPAAAGEAGKPAPPTEDQLRAEKLSKRILSLRESLASVDEKLAALRARTGTGSTTGQGLDITVVTGGMNTQDQLRALETQRGDLQRQLSEAEDEARRMGFSSGEIRTLPAATAFEDPPATQTPEQRLAAFRQRMAALQAELQRAEENLRSVRAAANSNATIPPDRVLAVNAPGVTTQDQIRLLEQKRDDVRRRIEALEEEARRAGISSGQLR